MKNQLTFNITNMLGTFNPVKVYLIISLYKLLDYFFVSFVFLAILETPFSIIIT